MSLTNWAVIAGGLAVIGWINWYFFLAHRRVAGAAAVLGAGGVQEVTVTVHGGYAPDTVRVRAGQPVRLVFDRQETSSCSEEIVFPDFGVRRFLPAFQRTVVDLPSPEPGQYEFRCGMSMLHGRLIAEAAREAR
jgi:plastocyanin domain-containing protein